MMGKVALSFRMCWFWILASRNRICGSVCDGAPCAASEERFSEEEHDARDATRFSSIVRPQGPEVPMGYGWWVDHVSMNTVFRPGLR